MVLKQSVFHPGQSDLLDRLPAPHLLYVGRVAVEKNIEAFLDMEVDGSKIVVGDGPSLEALRTKYPDVHFAGMKTGGELADYYRASDVFVFPSKTDTFGMVLIEALACGLPVAGYDVTGPKDIVTQPLLGAVDSQLSESVRRALSAPGSREERAEYTQKPIHGKKLRVFLGNHFSLIKGQNIKIFSCSAK